VRARCRKVLLMWLLSGISDQALLSELMGWRANRAMCTELSTSTCVVFCERSSGDGS